MNNSLLKKIILAILTHVSLLSLAVIGAYFIDDVLPQNLISIHVFVMVWVILIFSFAFVLPFLFFSPLSHDQ